MTSKVTLSAAHCQVTTEATKSTSFPPPSPVENGPVLLTSPFGLTQQDFVPQRVAQGAL